MARSVAVLLLVLCLNEKVFISFATSTDSLAVDLNAAATTVKDKLASISKTLAAETKAEKDQLATIRKEILDLTKQNFALDVAVRQSAAEKTAAEDRVTKLKKKKRQCEDTQTKQKKIRQQEFASVSTLRGLISQVVRINSSTVLELVGNVSAAELDGDVPAPSSAVSMIQLPSAGTIESSGLAALVQRVGQHSLNAVAKRHGKSPLHLAFPENTETIGELQVGLSTGRSHAQLDDLNKYLQGIEEQLTAESVGLAATCNKLSPAMTTAISYLKTKKALLRLAKFKRREADAAISTRQTIAKTLAMRNAKNQAKRMGEQQVVDRILATLRTLGLDMSGAATLAPATKSSAGKSAMDFISYLLDEMIQTVDSQVKSLKVNVDEAISKLDAAATDQTSKKKRVEDLQAGLLQKQKIFDEKQQAYNHAATAETEELKKMATTTDAIEKLQVMVNDMLWATASIPREMLLNVTDPMLTELSTLDAKKAKLKETVNKTEAAMNTADASLKEDEQSLAEAQQDLKEANDEVALLDMEKKALSEQLKKQQADAETQTKILDDLKALVVRYTTSA
jgi:Skp family chaperone for outer membrane proteins